MNSTKTGIENSLKEPNYVKIRRNSLNNEMIQRKKLELKDSNTNIQREEIKRNYSFDKIIRENIWYRKKFKVLIHKLKYFYEKQKYRWLIKNFISFRKENKEEDKMVKERKKKYNFETLDTLLEDEGFYSYQVEKMKSIIEESKEQNANAQPQNAMPTQTLSQPQPNIQPPISKPPVQPIVSQPPTQPFYDKGH